MMSDSEFWAGVGMVAVLFFGGLKLLVMMAFPRKPAHEETAYGDTTGWKE